MGEYYLIIIFVVAFLLGSIPWGVLISKIFFRTDIRDHGSGNIGTTNAMRSLGKIGGGSVFLLDFGKGILSGVLGLLIMGWLAPADNLMFFTFIQSGDAQTQNALATSFIGCVLGHIFSPWLKFKGGKGIAVAIGCLLLTYGLVGFAIELATFILLVVITRHVSVGSIVAAIICPFIGLVLFWGNIYAIIICVIAGLVVLWAHRENIKRLMSGTEPKIGDKKRATQEGK